MHRILLLSIRPPFASQILLGTKTIELRRVRPDVMPGDRVWIYATSPRCALIGIANVDETLMERPRVLWPTVRDAAGVSRMEYDAYFRGAERAVGIRLRGARSLEEPLSLETLRSRWPWFHPPQSYRYLPEHLTLAHGLPAMKRPPRTPSTRSRRSSFEIDE